MSAEMWAWTGVGCVAAGYVFQGVSLVLAVRLWRRRG